jgi:MFS superfamily sulfate permease-like transporter
MLNGILQGKRLGRYVPIVGWVRSYQRVWLRDDLVSGVVVGAIMIPVAMAYAQMAGVPVQAGLYLAIVGMTAYAIFATSRHLKITTSSTMSIMSIAVVAPLAAGDPVAFLALTSAAWCGSECASPGCSIISAKTTFSRALTPQCIHFCPGQLSRTDPQCRIVV